MSGALGKWLCTYVQQTDKLLELKLSISSVPPLKLLLNKSPQQSGKEVQVKKRENMVYFMLKASLTVPTL